ncbi:GNAT family N-acetyltransferase [Rhizobium sp. LEGMi198b]|uniref:GNAT family N-acetyltransferase n=1 Tax=unclassified Rhizobium TaxID=2613769 RepID=UPI000CDF4A17|nr:MULTISPECIES: GNAT family N-acetyltransferase [Rhizobium]AVA23127.1 GCN5-related N-acetyltransferase protein [Rhizobium sp. NXC24]MDK4739881.1 GNAT family N-acetyltransferase [Rhizobium sp. CNPSo 3464]UWU20487.1 GNAT family N-acetyltransferase [Rhizobium tropici]WFU01287.1 GNAT family N-acetyltransferase [Rhizobium sp. CB3171]
MEIRTINSLADFEEAHALIDAMSKWDAEQSRKFGVPDSELIEYIYGHTPETLMKKFNDRDAGFFLARMGESIAGCAGYSKSDDGIAELQKMYVRPEARGKGVARSLMTACLAAIRNDGYTTVRLETVTFMSEAIALYDAFGFKRSGHFRSVPPSLQPITIFMERQI